MMMKNTYLIHALLAFLVAANTSVLAQEKDPVLLTVDGDPVRVSEFEAVYKKNNRDSVIDRDDLEEYLELYINFRLKVREAEALGLDTAVKFKKELEGYQKQLAKPYLTDKEVTEKLVQEAYERSLQDVHARHILIKVGPDALPKDTLKAYNEIMDIRKKALKGDFDKLARKHSEDPSAKENGGDLGWFSVLRMVYPFETAAYTTPVGEISNPIRSRFGYHLIKVEGKREAQGEIRAAHIMIKTGKEASEEEIAQAKEKIMEVDALLEKGESFEDLAKKYSEDRGSASKGGELPKFGTGRMVPEFEKAAFGLKKDGDVSDPVLTDYGWHIVKRLERFPVPSFADIEKDLRAKVAKDSRSEKSKLSVLNRIKKEYGFTENREPLNELVPHLDSTLIDGKWEPDDALKMKKVLFTIGDKNYTQGDLAAYIGSHQVRRRPEELPVILNAMYGKYMEESLMDYEESKLEEKYPEYKALLKEYRDGILLFDLTDQKVWSKAVKDTAGLKTFHELHRNDFMWDTRLRAEMYFVQNDEIMKKLNRVLKKRLKKKERKKPTQEEILKEFNAESQLNLRIEDGIYQKNDEELLEKVEWEKGIYGPITDGENQVMVLVMEVLKPQPKTLREARGLVTAAYQNHLEKTWIKELREKYEYSADRSLLDRIK